MYLVDANILIDAKNRYYAFDIAPGFWEWLVGAHAGGHVCSIEAIRNEIVAGDDELADWAKANSAFFRPMDQAATAHFPALSNWANSQSFTPAALAGFTGSAADYLLVAYARAHDHVVVTHEQSNPTRRNRVMIPDACAALGVTAVSPFEMMRRTGATLHLRN
ncbi:DUF4411 family protein [Mycobacterium syngnathidarum]|uniref:Uncharacterized protein n=1 Tax=Mycobacterium syngnathidarum TaxID=1908205 RepID=A0A1S1K9B1_9MYCO|nr:DUF4411 family protein [Mycobacterium syngnathidarum]OHU01577.1 hypothetical protein BKG61_08690 [Mycobacterium syngnathidarum]